jgi:hypothetical protein
MSLREQYEGLDAKLTAPGMTMAAGSALVEVFARQPVVATDKAQRDSMATSLRHTLQWLSPLNQPGTPPRTPVIAKSRKLDGRRQFQGFEISIENRAGSVRKWHDKATDTKGETKMLYPYGYIRLTEGTDGDHVDCFIGPNEKAERVYVIHQMAAPSFKEHDEDKTMLGFDSPEDAKTAYLIHYDRPEFFGSMTAMSVEEFRDKVYRLKGKMIKGKKQMALALEPVDELDRWEKAVRKVGLRPEDFHLVVKYARQGHSKARKALNAVYRELEKAGGLGGDSTRDGSTVGTMGNFGSPARTAGANVRSDKTGPPQQDWPLGRQDMNKPGRRQKRNLPRAADKLDVQGLTQSTGGWARPYKLKGVKITVRRKEPQERTDARQSLDIQRQGRHELQQASKLALNDVDINRS